MSDNRKKLKEMCDSVIEKNKIFKNQIWQIDTQIEELQSQANAIEYYMSKTVKQLKIYLDEYKVKEISQINKFKCAVILEYEELYDIDSFSLSDWKIINEVSGKIIYQFKGIGWDDDAKIIKYMNDWSFGKDYLIHPLNTLDGTYGIYSNIDILNKARIQVEATRLKINNSKKIFVECCYDTNIKSN